MKPEREKNNRESYRANWWLFAEPRKEFRAAFHSLDRYIATSRTAKHRVFVFVPGQLIAESKVISVAAFDPLILGVLSSRPHVIFSQKAGGWHGIGNDPTYNHSDCFDPYPFPDCPEALKDRIRAIAEELDAHRKARQAEHPRLTLTQMYNVLENLRANEALTVDDERIKREGLVLILKELHDKLDSLVLEAYGWTDQPSDDEILNRLVALNRERSLQEKVGKVLWLRPDYQIPRFGSDAERARLDEERRKARAEQGIKPKQGALDLEDNLQEMMPSDGDDSGAGKPKFQTGNELAETADVMRVLASAPEPITIPQIARSFSQGKQIEKRVALTVLALARLGHITMAEDGQRIALRRN